MIVLLFCTELAAQEYILPLGGYDYIATDGAGKTVASGKLIITSYDAGNWSIKTFVKESEVGPQNGSGELWMQKQHEKIYIDLNLGVDDNNIVLVGTFDQGVVKGQWKWHTFVGIAKEGAFSAVRN